MKAPKRVPIRSYGISAVLLKEENGNTKVLLLRRTGATLRDEWCQVAGGIEKGETAWQAALREIREETQLVPDRFYSADFCEQFYEPDRECVSLVPVFVGYVGPDARVVINKEHSEFRWMNFEEADRVLPFAGQRKMLEHVRKEFVERPPTEWLRIRTESHKEDIS